jgi:hypothetical protein
MVEGLSLLAQLTEKVAGKVGELLLKRKDLQTKRFEQLVKPVMVDLERVHADYLKIFEGLRMSVLDPSRTIDAIARELAEARLVLEPTRSRLRSFGRTLSNADLSPWISDFGSTVDCYFGTFGSVLSTRAIAERNLFSTGTASSVLHSLLREIQLGGDTATRLRVAQHVTSELKFRREKWSAVTEAYSAAVIKATG